MKPPSDDVPPSQPPIGDPASYDPSRFAFVTGSSGDAIAVRPGEFLVATDFETVQGQLRKLVANDSAILVDEGEDVRHPWRLYTLAPDSGLDVATVIDLFRDLGIGVQPNHIYFANTSLINPNLINPNLINPLINPNLINPNLINPNLINPNLINPNLINPNLINAVGSSAGKCCPPAAAGTELDLGNVPPLLARPVPGRPEPAGAVNLDDLEIHIIDVVGLADDTRSPDRLTGELNSSTTIHRVDENDDRWADPGTAHGDFVRSVLELTEGIHAELWSAIGPIGDIDDTALISALEDVDKACKASKKVLNLSLGGYNDGDRATSALAGQIKAMIDDGWLIVAAAGNLASCRPVWPAALPGVVAVGAIDKCDRPATFTNYGSWVNACALGVEVEAQFPKGLADMFLPGGQPYRVNDDPEVTTGDFNTGWASWSGTSFAAPLVAARLARRLSQQPEVELTPTELGLPLDQQDKLRRRRRVRRAVDYLLKDPARASIPGLGTIVR